MSEGGDHHSLETVLKDKKGVDEAWQRLQKAAEDRATASSGGTKKASVPFMITKDRRQQLHDLGYSGADVDTMKPEDANTIIEGGVMKPKPEP